MSMFQRYPFAWPIIIIWLVLFSATIAVYYFPIGRRGWPVLNRAFIMRFNSLVLFAALLMIFVSGISQLNGVTKMINGRPLSYYHAAIGLILILAALNHLALHIKDIWRYIFHSKPKAPTPVPPPNSGN